MLVTGPCGDGSAIGPKGGCGAIGRPQDTTRQADGATRLGGRPSGAGGYPGIQGGRLDPHRVRCGSGGRSGVLSGYRSQRRLTRGARRDREQFAGAVWVSVTPADPHGGGTEADRCAVGAFFTTPNHTGTVALWAAKKAAAGKLSRCGAFVPVPISPPEGRPCHPRPAGLCHLARPIQPSAAGACPWSTGAFRGLRRPAPARRRAGRRAPRRPWSGGRTAVPRPAAF